MKVGDVVLADDDDVGFEGGKVGRPYLVVRVIGDPPELVYVVPRTTSGWEGVPVPAGLVPGLNKEGNFLLHPLQVDAADLANVKVRGELPDPYLSTILERIRTDLMELDE